MRIKKLLSRIVSLFIVMCIILVGVNDSVYSMNIYPAFLGNNTLGDSEKVTVGTVNSTTSQVLTVDNDIEYTTGSAINYEELVDVEQYIMENYMDMTEDKLEELIWPEIELNEIRDRNRDVELESEVGEDYDKEIRAYGYVWSYDFEDPTVTNNQGFIELERDEPGRKFEHLFDPNRMVYVRAFEVYGNYVAYSNQRQFEPEVDNKPIIKTTGTALLMKDLTDSRVFTKASASDDSGTTYFKDTGDDLDKLKIAIASVGSLSIDIDVDTLPDETAHLVLKGAFGGYAYIYLNGDVLGFVGSSVSKDYYAIEVSNELIESGTNTIEVYVYGLAWAKVDAISVVIDGGDTSDGEITDIDFEDWSISYSSSIGYYYTDLYANSTTENVDTSMDLKLVNSIGLAGLNHSSSSEYDSLDDSNETYSFSITLPDDDETGESSSDSNYDETGNWNLFTMLVDDKEVINIDSKGFYYEDSVGIRNFDMDFSQDIDDYTNGSVIISAEVDDLFNRPFSYIECPDGTIVYDYDTTYEVYSSDEYTFIIAEPDGTETEYTHDVSNIDTTAPTIELSGDESVTIIEENTYVDMGVVASDELSGLASDDPTIDYDGLDTDSPSPGTYTVTYTISDNAGNSNSIIREVIVKNKPLEVNTDSITKSSTEVTLSGSIAYYGEEEITEKGLVWGLISNPTVDSNSGSESWTGDITNKDTFSDAVILDSLYDNVTYNVRAYAETESGSVAYGDNMTFDSSDKSYGSFEVASTSYSVLKGDSVTIDINRKDGSDGEATVYYRTINGSAVAGTQFTSKSSYVIFSDGDAAAKSVSISTSDYDTWEEDNREFYFEIYEVDGDGNIGSSNFATITFDDDIDEIESVSSDSYTTIWSTTTDYTSTSNYTANTSDASFSSSYAYWIETADSIIGRGKATLVISKAKVTLALRQNTNSSWSQLHSKSYSYTSSTYDGTGYTSTSGSDISNGDYFDIYIDTDYAEGVTGGDHGKVYNPSIEVIVEDSTAPTLDSYYSVSGDYAEGDTIYISAKFSEIVTSSNFTDVSLKIQLCDENGDTVIKEAAYVTGDSTDTLVFKFTVPEGTYNTKLYTTGFNNGSYIKDIMGNSFTGYSTSTTINTNVKIAATSHEITFSPDGNTAESTSHSTTVTVAENASAPADIISTEYLWTTETDTQGEGFVSFSSGDILSIEGVTGNYYLHIKSEDDYGCETYMVSNYFNLNNTDPTFSLSASTEDWTNSDVTISISDLPDDASVSTRQYLSGYYSVDDFDTSAGTNFSGDSFIVDTNAIYSVYLKTTTGLEYVNNITIENLDKEVPVVEIETDGTAGETLYIGETTVTAYDEGDSELATLQYAWTNSETKPTSEWSGFNSGDELETSDSGTWYLHVDAIDNAGNETYSCSEAFMIDTTEPTITVTGTNPDEWTNEEVDIAVYAYKDNLSYVMLSDLSTVDAESVDDLMVVDTTYTVDSNGYYSFIAVDESGNTAEANVNITKIDTDGPNIIVDRSEDDWTEGPITLTISADDDASIIYDDEGDFLEYGGVGDITIQKIDSDTFEDYSDAFTYEVSENGTYQVNVKDSLGNFTTRDIDISNIDTTYPYVETDNTDYGSKNSAIDVNLSYNDAEMGTVDNKEYSIENSTTTPSTYDEYDGSTITFDAEGTYYIHYRATDGVGHETIGYYGPYTFSSSDPSITIESTDAEDYQQSHEGTINVEYNHYSEGEIHYQWSDSAETPTSGWDNTIDNNTTLTREGDNGDLYLHVRVTSDGSYFYGSRMFRFDNTAPTITLVGDNPMVVAYGDTYVEEGATYEDTYDLWPTYTEPSLSEVDTNQLGSYELTYTVVDDAGNETSIIRTINVEDVTSPTINDVDYNDDEDSTVSFDNESFEEVYSDDLTDIASIKIESLPSNGVCQLNDVDITVNQVIVISDVDSLSYSPSSNWYGSDVLSYSAYDSYGNNSNTGNINITIASVNDKPSASDDIVNVDEDASVIINVRSNDSDVETGTTSLTIDSLTQPSNGASVNNNDGTITYTPNSNFNGEDEFTYTVKDENGETDTGTVTITINSVNDIPTAPTTLQIGSVAPYYGGETVLISWSSSTDVDGDSVSYELDYYDGSSWNNIDTNISDESISFTIPSINTEVAKLRIKSYDGTVWSSSYYEGSSFTIDSNNPEVEISLSSSDWKNTDYTVDLTYKDSLAIDCIYYEVSQDTITPDSYTDYSNESVSNVESILSVAKTIDINEEGINYIHYKIVDIASNSVISYTGAYKLDKTAPEDFDLTAVADSTTEITISGMTTDCTDNSSDVSGLQMNSYDYSIDGTYNDSYESDGSYTYEDLTPNGEYTFKMNAIDNTGNVTETSEVRKYTRAEDPTGATCDSKTKNSLIINLSVSEKNDVDPAYKVWLTLKDDEDTAHFSEYSRETSRSFSTLLEDTSYDLWVQTRNEDLEENDAVKLGTYKTNKVPEFEIIDADENIYVTTGEAITLTGTVTDTDNETITISGTIDENTKNVEVSETENGTSWSLTFDVSEDDIDEGNYTGIIITAEDSNGDNLSDTYTGDIIVDKTVPNAPSLVAEGEWSSEDSENVVITDNGDLGNPESGVDSIQYSLLGAETSEGYITYTESFDVLEEGTTSVTARVVDKAGNISDESSTTVYIDRTNPQVIPTSVDGTTFTNGKENETVDWTNEEYTVEMTYSDAIGIDSIYYEISQDTTTPENFTDYIDESVSESENVQSIVKSFDINDEGTNYIHYRIVDFAGNTTTGYYGPYKLDKTTPNTPSIVANEEWSMEDSETVSITDNGDLGDTQSGVYKIEYNLSGAEVTDGFITYEESFQVTEEGTTIITARVVDTAGNISNQSTKTVYIDRTNPEVAPTSVDGTVFTNGKENETVDWTNEEYTVEMTYSDSVGIDSLYYEVSQDTTTPEKFTDYMIEFVSESEEILSSTKTVTINDEGVNYIHYKIVDLAGNTTIGYYGPYKLDKTAPEEFEVITESTNKTSITISGTTTDTTTNSSITVSGMLTEGYNYSIDGSYNENYESDGIYTFSGLNDGKKYSIKMKAVDYAGNIQETEEVIISTEEDEEEVVEDSLETEIDSDSEDSSISDWEVSVTDHETTYVKVDIDSESSSNEDEVLESTETSNGGELTEYIEVNLSTDDDIIIIGLTAKIVKEMEENNVELVIENEVASYTIPAAEMYIDTVVSEFGTDIDMEQVSVQIEISIVGEEEMVAIEKAISQDYDIVADPISFEISCNYNDEAVEISKFNTYISRQINMPEGIESDSITTAIVVNDDGSTYPVPTKVTYNDGKYYAEINSLTNSNYILIFNEAIYDDIEGHWAKEAISDLGNRTILEEISGDMFKPNENITRGEFITTVVRALGLKASNGESQFTDTNIANESYQYITTAFEYQLIKGYDDGNAYLDNSITREEAMIIISRAMEITGLDDKISQGNLQDLLSHFADVEEISDWSISGVSDCINAQIVYGKFEDKISPKDEITRAEAVVMIRRLLIQSGLI